MRDPCARFLVFASLACSWLMLAGCEQPAWADTEGAHPEPPPPALQTVVLRRLLAAGTTGVDDGYANSLSALVEFERARTPAELARSEPLARAQRALLLVRAAALERSRADELFAAAFWPEAAHHYRNLLELPGIADREQLQQRWLECQVRLPQAHLSVELETQQATLFAHSVVPGETAVYALCMQLGEDWLGLDPERVGVSPALGPQYLEAELAWQRGALETAKQLYGQLLECLEPDSPAHLDASAKLVELCSQTGDAELETHLRRVLPRFSSLGLRLGCQPWQLPGPQDVVVASGRSSFRGIALRNFSKPVEEACWQPLPPVGPRFLTALQARRARVLEAAISSALHNFERDRARLLQLADGLILCQRFERAAELLDRMVGFAPDAAFKALACRIALLLSEAQPEDGLDACLELLDAHRDSPRLAHGLRFLRARCLEAFGRFEQARTLYAELASEAGFELAPDAALACALLDRRSLRITVPQLQSADGMVSVELRLRNVDELEIALYPICLEPSDFDGLGFEQQLLERIETLEIESLGSPARVQLDCSGGALAETRCLVRQLQLPAPGVYLLVAQSGGLRCRAAAVFDNSQAQLARMPHSSLLMLRDETSQPLAGLHVYTQDQLLGVSDADGMLVFNSRQLSVQGARADEDFELVCVGPQRLFRCTLALDGVPMPSSATAARGPLLYVFTERALYLPGDVLRFCGILRHESAVAGRRPARRFEVLPGEWVRVEIKDEDVTVFSQDFETDTWGSFDGSYAIPASAKRKSYALEVSYQRKTQSARFEVRDFVRPDYAITLTPGAEGFEVFAGTTWGSRVVGAELWCLRGQEELQISLDARGRASVPAGAGELLAFELREGGQPLAYKEGTFHAPIPVPQLRVERAEPQPGSQDQPAAAEPATAQVSSLTAEAPLFELLAEQSVHFAGDSLGLVLVSRSGGAWSAVVALGNDQAFDADWLSTTAETARIRLPVSPAYDPEVWASARFSSADSSATLQKRLPVHAALLDLRLDAPHTARPGESVVVRLQTATSGGTPAAAQLSLAAVDEAVFALAEDPTPDIYRFFYREREASCAIAELEHLPWGGCEAVALSALELGLWQPVNVETVWYPVLGPRKPHGLGGGAAGAYGDRYGHGSLEAYGGSVGVESACDVALTWSARHQSGDGRWDSDGFGAQCQQAGCGGPGAAENDVLVTALNLLAFYEQGHTARVGQFKRAIRKGQGFLTGLMAADGAIGRDSGQFWLLGHTVATLALCDAFLLSDDVRLTPTLEQALAFLLAARNEGSGWGFGPQDGASNALMTGWAAQALRAAELAGFAVPAEAWQGVLGFFDSVTDLRGWTWFASLGQADPVLGGDAEQAELPEWTAFALLARLCAGESPRTLAVRRGVDVLLRARPGSSPAVSFPYWYAAQQVMFRVGGRSWKRWNSALQQTLLESQCPSGSCSDGSWHPSGRWGAVLGRCGVSALGDLSLGVYYRYLRLSEDGELADDEAEIRLHFPKTAYWNPKLSTDAAGQAYARFALPDTITSLRLTSRGVTKDTLVGQAVRWIEVRQDFFVKLKTPAHFYRGDQARIYADVYNDSGATLHASLSLEGPGWQALDGGFRELELPADGLPRRVAWEVQVGSQPNAVFALRADAGSHTDAITIEVPVQVLGRKRSWVQSQAIEVGEEMEIELPPEVDRQSATLELRFSPSESPIYQLLHTLRFLVEFPHGCVEQTMSRFLPAVVVADALRALEIPTSDFMAGFDEVTDAGVQRLLDFQSADGGWGWFGSDPSHPFMSAYVVFGLHRAQQAGISVPARALSRGVAFLKQVLPEQQDVNLRACIHFALASAGAAELESMRELARDDAALNSYARALLALAFAKSGAHPEARAMLTALDAQRLEADGLAHFETTDWYYRWENVSIECTAYALLAYVEIDPQHAAIEPLTRWLLSQRQGDRWRTSKDSAAAIYGLIAVATRAGGDLAEVAAATRRVEEQAGDPPELARSFSVQLNQEHTRQLRLDFGNPVASRFDCSFDAGTLSADNRLRFEGDFSAGCPRMEAQAIVRVIEPRAELPAVREGLGLARAWSIDPAAWKEGEEVEVTLIVHTEQDVDFVLVEAPIPAGGRILPDSAAGSFAAFEARFDRALFYLTHLPAGSHTLRFRFACDFPGDYALPPARAELMYNLDIFAASQSARGSIQGSE